MAGREFCRFQHFLVGFGCADNHGGHSRSLFAGQLRAGLGLDDLLGPRCHDLLDERRNRFAMVQD
jgi:hypothetical protein